MTLYNIFFNVTWPQKVAAKTAFSMYDSNICLPKYDCHQAIKYFDEKMLFLQLVYAMFFKFCNFFCKNKTFMFFHCIHGISMTFSYPL